MRWSAVRESPKALGLGKLSGSGVGLALHCILCGLVAAHMRHVPVVSLGKWVKQLCSPAVFGCLRLRLALPGRGALRSSGGVAGTGGGCGAGCGGVGACVGGVPPLG